MANSRLIVGNQYIIRAIYTNSNFAPWSGDLIGQVVTLVKDDPNPHDSQTSKVVQLRFASVPEVARSPNGFQAVWRGNVVWHKNIEDNDERVVSMRGPTLEPAEDTPIPYDEEDQIED